MKVIALDKARVASRRFDDEMTVINLRGRSVHRLNPTAARLWGILAGGGGYDDLVRSLCETYEVDSAVAANDVDCFLASLEEAGLIKVNESNDGSASGSVGGTDE